MKPAPLPENEESRIKALKELELLDTLPEDVYDDITRIASEICGTPASLITLIDTDRQWFKSKHGLVCPETPRDQAFCAHAIVNQEDYFIVPDARYDERFFDNPLTKNEPYVIFYAGVPLRDKEGHAFGTLCVIDSRPRTLSEQKLLSLKALANLVAVHFELRKTRLELKKILVMIQNSSNNQIATDLLTSQIKPIVDPMLQEIETLLNGQPSKGQVQHLNSLQNMAQSLKSVLNATS